MLELLIRDFAALATAHPFKWLGSESPALLQTLLEVGRSFPKRSAVLNSAIKMMGYQSPNLALCDHIVRKF
jgi:hypothetical protein